MARKTKRRRKERPSTPPVPTGYDASWDLSDSCEAFEKKAEEWDRRDWMPWLREHLTFPFEVVRQEDMDDERYLFGGEPPPEHFAIGSQMTVLGISDAAFEPDFHGVLVDVRQGRCKIWRSGPRIARTSGPCGSSSSGMPTADSDCPSAAA